MTICVVEGSDMKGFVRVLLMLGVLIFFSRGAQAQDPFSIVLSSSAYGVVAGGLLGAASLAFTESPGDHLINIARGASLGLYAGLSLGAYIVFVESPSAPMVSPHWDPQGRLDGATLAWRWRL